MQQKQQLKRGINNIFAFFKNGFIQKISTLKAIKSNL